MSYGRNPHYIWSDGEHMSFNATHVPEKVLNAFLYEILLTNRREELIERLKEGKEEWLKPIRFKDVFDLENLEEVEVSQDDPELVAQRKWMENLEDDILKQLMGC